MSWLRKAGGLLAAALMATVIVVGGGSLNPRSALAEDPAYSITINSANPGSTYNAYKIFDVTNSGTNYAYTIDSSNPFFGTVQTYATNNSSLFALEQIDDTTYNVIFKGSADTDLSGLAEALKTTFDGLATKPTADATGQAAGSATTVTLNPTSAGYYFITTTTGTICSLSLTNASTAVTDKNGVPTIDKFVRENSLSSDATSYGFGKQNDANIGDTVEFCIAVNIEEGATHYVVHDKLSAGLTLTDDEFKYGTSKDPSAAAQANAFLTSLSITGVTTPFTIDKTVSGESFTVTISNDLLDKLLEKSVDTLYIFYTATLNENAQVGAVGNENEAWLQYGNDPSMTSEHIRTKTYTWPLTIYKFTGDISGTHTNLAGATFTLYYATVSGTTWTRGGAVSFERVSDSTTYKRVASGGITQITTTATGQINLQGLDSGYYILEEVEAPAGYNKLTSPIHVSITPTSNNYYASLTSALTVGYTYAAEDSSSNTASSISSGTGGTVNVQNSSNPVLPTTGGMGTTVLYVVGTLLVAFAGGTLVLRKRA